MAFGTGTNCCRDSAAFVGEVGCDAAVGCCFDALSSNSASNTCNASDLGIDKRVTAPDSGRM